VYNWCGRQTVGRDKSFFGEYPESRDKSVDVDWRQSGNCDLYFHFHWD
jgi:hypothetical protein